MNSLFARTKRVGAGLSAGVLLLLAALPALFGAAPVYAGQVATRSIEMSSASIGTVTAGQGVKYLVTFTPATTGAQSLVLDFCNSAIIGAACTAPSGFTAASATLTTGTGFTSWTATMAASTVKLTKGAGSALGTSAVNFTLNNITNPTAVGTFYARLTTYTDTAYGGGSPYTSPTVPGAYSDAGGFALSTANTIAITATVMETLTFCTSKAAPATGCTSTTTPSLTLGSGSPVTLGTTTSTDTAYTQLSTNALTGAIVRMNAFSNSGTTPACAGLSRDGGTTCPIAAKGAFGAIGNGSGLFGLNVADGVPLGGTGSGAVAADSDYGTTGSSYGMAAAVLATYGDPIQSSTAACADVNSLLTFAAAAATTTPAGVYSANESLVATGTF